MNSTPVREIMTKDVYSTTGETPVVTAAETMVHRRHGSAVVMEGGWLAGIFTERDVLRAAASCVPWAFCKESARRVSRLWLRLARAVR